MALKGVWQLQKLILSYCDWGGSSRGIRAFMESHLPAFKEKNPQLEVVTELIRGQHPHLKGFYRNKNERVICVKNLDPDDILVHTTRLRNALGRKVLKLKTRHVTQNPSVQGAKEGEGITVSNAKDPNAQAKIWPIRSSKKGYQIHSLAACLKAEEERLTDVT